MRVRGDHVRREVDQPRHGHIPVPPPERLTLGRPPVLAPKKPSTQLALPGTRSARPSAAADATWRVDPGRPDWRGRWAAIALVFPAFPTVGGFALTLPLGGGSLRYSDLVLPTIAVWCLPVVLRERRLLASVLLFAPVVFICYVGYIHGAPIRWLIRDARPPAYIACGSILGTYLWMHRESWEWNVKVLAWFICIVAVLTAASQFTSEALVGSSAADVLYYGTSTIQLTARRAQIETDPLALFLLCSYVGAFASRIGVAPIIGRSRYAALLAGSFVIIFLSYSRNSVLGAAAAAVAGFVAPTALPYFRRIAGIAGGILLVLAVAVPLLTVAAETGVLNSELHTFSVRVIDGLSSSARSQDDSVSWRNRESQLAIDAFEASPIVGTGAGVFYRPRVTGEPFTDDSGRIYVHDYALWLLVTGGVIYFALMATILVGTAVTLLCGVRLGAPLAVPAGCGFAALLAVSYVAPWPEQFEISPLIGAIVAGAWLLRQRIVPADSS